jgi:hypothetical protein
VKKWQREPRLKLDPPQTIWAKGEEGARAQEKEKKRIRRLERELKKVGFNSIKDFEDEAEKLGCRLGMD